MFTAFFNAESVAAIDQRAARIAPHVIRATAYTLGLAVVAAAALLVIGVLGA